MLQVAEEAVELAQADPRRARKMADRALTGADGDMETIVVARRALGLAARELHDLADAEAHLRSAIRMADRTGLARRAGEARMSLSLVLALQGRLRPALRTIDRAATVLRGLDAARLEMQRSILLQRVGRTDEALDGYRRARRALRRHGDELWEARLLTNRGLLRAYRGDLVGAAEDHHLARTLAAKLDQHLLVALIEHNLGFIAGRAGDLPAGLTWFDQAESSYRRLGAPLGVLHADRGELLLTAGLIAEAQASASAAVDELARAGNAIDLAEARLLLARATLTAGAFDEARRQAGAARRAFHAQDRSGWGVLAASVALQAAVAAADIEPAEVAGVGGLAGGAVPEGAPDTSGGRRERRPAMPGHRRPSRVPPARLLAEALRVADELADAGWERETAAARVIAGRVALARGEVDVARRELGAAARGPRRRPAAQRAQALHAAAVLRLAEGDRRGATRALGRGIRLLERHRASLGATELRAMASGPGVELADLGLRLALVEGRPADVLRWSEMWRAGALRLTPVRPPADAVAAGLLTELRTVAAAARAVTAEGGDAGRLLARRAALEDEVRRHARRIPGDRRAMPSAPAPIRHDDLVDHALVELAVAAGHVYAVVVARRRTTVHALGPAGAIAAEADAARFALRRLARGVSGRSEEAARAALGASAVALERLLLSPLRRRIGDSPLVVVPTGRLHGLPWAVLPHMVARPVSIAPSAALWRDAHARPAPALPAVVVAAAGPGLPAASAEVAAVARHHPGVRTFTGQEATVAAVLAALDGADVGHVAAHGELRADSPLFSSLTLADGPLTAYDLEGLRAAPPLLVLSSCDAGVSDVRPADELLGLSTALLAVGARAVVAPVVAVADEATSVLMGEMHGHLAAGVSPAEAVALLHRPTDPSPQLLAASLSLVCLGAG